MTWGTPMTAETSISHKKMEFRGKKMAVSWDTI
jgi:hypothetical protein